MPESLKEDGRPAQQWYWDDWFSSHDVQSCSFEAQGLWINMIGIMFSSEIRGTLTINGIALDNKSIAKRFGKSEKNINKLITELEEARVFSRLEDGTIYSRRMYKESKRKDKISLIRSLAGKKGMESRWQQDDGKAIAKSNNKTITKITASSPSPSSTTASSSTSKINKEIYISLWNAFAIKHGLSQIEQIETGSIRESHLKVRIKKMGDQPEKFFSEFLSKIEEQPFLLGDNKDGWLVTFDWIINSSNYQKIIEEQYKKRGQKEPSLWTGPKKRDPDPF